MSKCAFIVNPAAGRSRGGQFLSQAESLGIAPDELIVTESTGGGESAAKIAVQKGHSRLIAVGGDGTFSEVIRGSVGVQGIDVGLIPMGTGNDFAGHFGYPMNLPDLVHLARNGTAKPIDLAEVGGRPFINVLACGFDAQVGERVNAGHGRAKGTLAYISALLYCLAHLQATQFTIEVDGHCIQELGIVCAIANASRYGGGMKIAPNADPTDGMLDVVFIGELSRLQLLQQFPKLFTGAHLAHPKVKVLRGSKVSVHCDAPMPYMLDGELMGNTPFEAIVQPKKVNVIVPMA